VTDQPDPFELFGLDSTTAATAATADPTTAATADPTTAATADPDRPVIDDGDGGDGGGAHDDYVAVRSGDGSGGRGRRWLLLLGVPLLVIVVLVGGVGIWVDGKINPGSMGEEVPFTVSRGATTSAIATQLAKQKIVTNATVFEWYVKWKGGDPFQAGDYEGLRMNMPMGDVVDILKAGPPPPKSVSFLVREGLWESETRALILQKFPTMEPAALDAALASTHPPMQPTGSDVLEGFLFPATYEVARADVANAQKLVDQMITAFNHVSEAEGLPDASVKLKGVAGSHVITPYEALIVASLVESEAKVDEDRPKIARVIYNRLARGEPLGIDATVQYSIRDRKATLTDKDLKTESPYNTRLKTGLPPTPINSPGQKSIDAALNPAPGDWLYYVLTDKDGHHYFTNNFADFQRAVNDAKARGVF
jgi:UPF0755 protein